MKYCPNCKKEYSDELYYCLRCNYPLKRIEGSKIIYREDYNQPHKEINNKKNSKIPIVECPYCHSTNTNKITNTSKAVHTALFGIFSMSRNSKQWHCNNCNSDF